jgi:hypothetical protein
MKHNETLTTSLVIAAAGILVIGAIISAVSVVPQKAYAQGQGRPGSSGTNGGAGGSGSQFPNGGSGANSGHSGGADSFCNGGCPGNSGAQGGAGGSGQSGFSC